jgi:hypothetical protein
VGTLPLRVFRQILVLRFVTGGLADGIRIDSEATSLKGTFSAYDYDALNPDVPVLKAPLSSFGGRWMRRDRFPRSAFRPARRPAREPRRTLSPRRQHANGETNEERRRAGQHGDFPGERGLHGRPLRGPARRADRIFVESWRPRRRATSFPICRRVDQDLGPERARLGGVFLAYARGHRGDAASLADVEAGKDLAAALERFLDDFFPDYRRAPAKMRSLRMKANLCRNPWTWL